MSADREAGVLGWDVGGVHTKVARVVGGRVVAHALRAYELQRAPEALPALLRELAAEVGATADDRHALTMTAELSQYFRFKAAGVSWVLDGVAAAFPGANVRVLGADGRWYTVADARGAWRAVAAANWMATAAIVARTHADALLADIGSTTTDLIPIVTGDVIASGRDDPGRLAQGELLYLGAVRTPVEAIVHEVPLGGAMAGVSAEAFALAGDVYVWRGELAPEDYATPTPDGRPATREFCGERLARVVCADRAMVGDAELDAIAACVADAQCARIAAAMERLRRRHPRLTRVVAVGLGAWMAARAAASVGLAVVDTETFAGGATRLAPAAAAALLLAETPA